MALRELVLGADIQNGHQTRLQPLRQRLAGDRLHRVASVEIVVQHPVDLGEVALADPAERAQQRHHLGIAGEAVENMLAAALGLDQPGPAQDLQMARGVGEAHARLRGQFLDRALSLRQRLQQFEPVCMAERLGNLGQAFENQPFRPGA
jgi:hypothetical protein